MAMRKSQTTSEGKTRTRLLEAKALGSTKELPKALELLCNPDSSRGLGLSLTEIYLN